MKLLDNLTLDGIAEVICGDGTDWYRKGYQLAEFFRRAGVESPDHDGTTRKAWALQQLQQINTDPNAMAKVLKRLADPLEYRANAIIVNQVIDNLNSLLSIEGLQIRLDGINPEIYEIEPEMATLIAPVFAPVDPPDFSTLTADLTLQSVLNSRWVEAQRCVDAKAFVAAIVMMGSLLEGVLFSVATSRMSEALQSKSAPKHRNTGKTMQVKDWKLNDLINVSLDCRWVGLDAHRFSHVLRDFRNMVHPLEQARLEYVPDEDTCEICWRVVRAALNDVVTFNESSPNPPVTT